MRVRYPTLQICGVHHGYFDKSGAENAEVIKKIRTAAPDILFVCFGFPAQEKWITDNLSSLPSVKLALGLGGSLDVWSGNIRRAPLLVQKAGLEWLWRTVLEPKRARIFLDIPHFLFLNIKKAD
jgi:N-acetylglucosaminyldiphosphoundecaprenol N-acetyl-beta-D-mannosaminyltransferase